MSSQEPQNFNLQFVKDIMNQWTAAAVSYEREAEKSYSLLRSYLTLYQFRLHDSQKHDIREMLSQSLDEIEKMDLVEDMDNYLDGFCFKLDPSVLPKTSKIKPKSVKIEIAPEETRRMGSPTRHTDPPSPAKEQPQRQAMPELDSEMLDNFAPVNFTENTVDYTDFYQLQFLQ